MTLGASIKAARESARISLEDLSAITSIRAGLLSEIENDNFQHCGGDTYARGHIRTIAAKLNVDAAQWIVMYEEEHSTEGRNIHELLVENNVAKVPHEKRTMSWKVPASVSLFIVLVLVIVQIVVSNTRNGDPIDLPTPATSATATSSPTPTSSTETTDAVSGGVTLEVVAVRGSSQVDFVVDGQHLYKGPLLQGDSKSFTAEKSISIYFSNPAGLDVTLNGELLAPLGGENQEVRRTFRAQ